MADNLMLQQFQTDVPGGQNVLKARCSDSTCQHEWIVAYLPMPIEKAALLMRRAACPRCADERPVVAHD